MLNNPNPLFSKVEWCRYYNHLTTLNLSHFKVVEAMGLKLVASVPCNTIATLQKFIQIYQLVQYLLQEKQRHRHVNRQRDRQTGDLISKFSFLESRLKNNEQYSVLFSHGNAHNSQAREADM
jgi:hypothetical protein